MTVIFPGSMCMMHCCVYPHFVRPELFFLFRSSPGSSKKGGKQQQQRGRNSKSNRGSTGKGNSKRKNNSSNNNQASASSSSGGAGSNFRFFSISVMSVPHPSFILLTFLSEF